MEAAPGSYPGFSELTPEPDSGRVYEEAVRTGFGDVRPGGRVRLDAIARWLQDAAYFDAIDCFGYPGAWLVRRTRIRVERFPHFDEPLKVRTWCSGIGRAVAERRSTLTGADGARLEAVALWVCVDLESGRPARPPRAYAELYATSAQGRRARSGLRHPPAPEGCPIARTWTFHAADLDLAAHVNNAVYWAVLDEELDAECQSADVEAEFRAPGLPGEVEVLADGPMRWIRSVDGTLLASILVS